jgi:hypothetical protein
MIAALLIMAIILLGWIVVQMISPRAGAFEALAISYPLGSGLLTFSLFLTSWIGIPISTISLVSLYLALIIGAIVIGRRIRREDTDSPWWYPAFGSGAARIKSWILPLGIISGLSILAGYLSIFRSYSTWDAIGIWAVKGVAIAREGTIFAAGEWGSHGLSYPLNIPLQVASYTIFGADVLNGSKLIFPIYYFSLLLGVFAILRKQHGDSYAGLSSLLIGSTPIIFEHATIGYANLPFTTYLVLGVLVLFGSNEESFTSGDVLAGLLIGLSTWTRPEGIFLVLGGMLVAAIFERWSRSTMLLVLRTSVFILVVVVPWQVFSRIHAQPSLFADSFAALMTNWSSSSFHLDALYWIVRYAARNLLDPQSWGLLVPAGVLIFLVKLPHWKRGKEEWLNPILGLGVGVGAMILLYFYVASYKQDLIYLLGTSVDRILMPCWILMFVGSIKMLQRTPVEEAHQQIEHA